MVVPPFVCPERRGLAPRRTRPAATRARVRASVEQDVSLEQPKADAPGSGARRLLHDLEADGLRNLITMGEVTQGKDQREGLVQRALLRFGAVALGARADQDHEVRILVQNLRKRANRSVRLGGQLDTRALRSAVEGDRSAH